MRSSVKSSKKANQSLITTAVSEAESERRLRPVLDALYAQNTKQALKLVQQALQKRPGWPAARALRACVYHQSERWNDADREMLELRSDLDTGKVPIDEDGARKMHMYYREMRKEKAAGEVYEQAWKADAGNLKLAEMAFCLYVRGYAFGEAQKIATKLHRVAASKTQKYALWAAAALYLSIVSKTRSVDSNDPPDQRILKLVCAMMSKALAASGTPSSETARFAARVYRDAGDHIAAKELISNPRLVMDDAEVLQIRSELVGVEDSVSDSVTVLLNHDSDSWYHWLRFINHVEKDAEGKKKVFDLAKKVMDLDQEDKVKKRGPLLSKLEILYRTEDYDCLAESVVEYFRHFGGKSICAHDLRPYLCFLRENENFETIFAKCSAIVEEKGGCYDVTLCWLQLWFNRLDVSPEQLFRRYATMLSSELEVTDRQEGDDYILLAVLKLLPSPLNNQKSSFEESIAVLKSITLLEAGLSRSLFNFHFKLLLIHLYISVGGIERVEALWKSLGVKHVQISTLSHMVLRPLFEMGHHDSLSSLLANVGRLWNECDREIPECTSKAFQVGSLNAAVEFVLFRIRLENSAILAEASAVEAQLQLALDQGEALGIDRSLSYLRRDARFAPSSLSSMRLIDSDDDSCLRFWHEQEYNPNSRITGISDEKEEGPTCPPLRKAMISANLQSLEDMLSLASPNGSQGVGKGKMTNAVQYVNENLTEEGSGEYGVLKLRLDISRNMQEVRELMGDCGQRVLHRENGSEPRRIDTIDVLTRATELSQRIVDMVDNTIGAPTSNSAMTELTPWAVRTCGRICFDMLLVTSVALVSFGPALARLRRRSRKTAKTGGKISEYENLRQAVLLYRDSIMVACTRMQQWIAGYAGSDSCWPLSLFSGDEEGLVKSLPFLPEILPYRMIGGDDEPVQNGEGLTRENLCQEIMQNISSSVSFSCSRILETLGSITRKMKLVDL